MSLLLCLLLAGSPRSVEVRRAEFVPRIDGVIETGWFGADTADRFVQYRPQQGTDASEETEVYVLQDDANLYVAVRGWARKAPPVGQLYGMEDEVTLYIDPMDSRNSGYFFKLYGSGLLRSGLVLDNGASQDWSWEGVWYGAVRLHPDRLEAEFRVPFKSIRYKEGATEWGFDVERFICRERENSHLVEFREEEGGFQVSGFARLEGIEPRARGNYFELFPEGYVRYDQGRGDERGTVKPFASLNLKWDLGPQTTLNATALPDFAQIESDPYSFNISRYPVYLAEQRPFFVEGSELFRMTALGEGFFSPLRLFYSRRIGRPVAGEPVPIIAGTKLTTRSRDWSFGALGAVTDQASDSAGGLLEPRRGFAVLSGRAGLPDNTNLGLQFAGTMADARDYNWTLGSDWSFSEGSHRGTVQAAFSDRAGTPGWALNSGYAGLDGRLYSFGTLRVFSDSFSVEDIGYVPWAGQKQLNFGAGPLVRGRGRYFRRFIAVPSLYASQEPGSDRMSVGAAGWSEVSFRNWGLNLDGNAGRTHEADTGFFGRNASLSFWGNSLKDNLNIGLNAGHGYNYSRGWVADNWSGWANYTYYLWGRVAVMLVGSSFWEADPGRDVVGVTSVLRPRVDFRINSTMAFNVYSEMVFQTPGTSFDSTRFAGNRVGFLFSWNFRPKSWLFVALNEHQADYGDGLELASRVAAVKLRWLFYF
ncbi:hypothetical protein JXB37_03360 [candidate division WOR-3 bacterium]|nr:hypothetical protein [candidate division WOR-3 bacterium]